MKKVLITLILFGFIGAAGGIYLFNKPLESIESMKSIYTIKASELLAAFEEDESIANSKFLDKVIEVEGKVEKVENTEGKTTIYLNADNPMSSIIFQLEKSSSKIKPGEIATFKGICTGSLMDVVMVRGVQM